MRCTPKIVATPQRIRPAGADAPGTGERVHRLSAAVLCARQVESRLVLPFGQGCDPSRTGTFLPMPHGTWTLPDSAGAPRAARRHLHDLCGGCGRETVETAELLVSEVVSNAVQHGSGPVFVRASVTGDDLLVQVEDCGAGVPAPVATSEECERGRGLRIVAALAAEWGTLPVVSTLGTTGKTVWFRLRDQPTDSQDSAAPGS